MSVLVRSALAVIMVLGVSSCANKGGTDSTNTGGNANLVIQGTITGLAGSGLVLQNNGASDLSVPLGGSFLFTGIAEKSDYNITVKVQPTAPTQICTVTLGTGKIVFDPIRNVLITCVTQTYAIRGGVSGLTGTGLTLLLNGGSSLAIAPGTNVFSFPAIASATRYDITIGTQPTGQTCTVGTGSGTVGAVDVTNVAVTCTTPGLTIGGNVIGLGSSGLTVRLNGGTPLSISAGASSFTFPTVLQTGNDYSVLVASPPAQPLSSCLMGRAKGRVGSSGITDIVVRCFSNGGLDSYTGTYAVSINGRRNYLTLWFDGTFSMANRIDDNTCASNGNGVEYGVYKRTTAGAFFVQFAADNTGACGLWFGGATPGQGGGVEGTLARTGNTLTLSPKDGGSYVLQAVESVPTLLVGAFTRADGQDGSFVVFESDGTYLQQETQPGGGTLSTPTGYERGCYVVTGATFTVSLASSCQPNGFPALDLNGTAGFSAKNGAGISFVITSATTVTIDGVQYVRIAPAG